MAQSAKDYAREQLGNLDLSYLKGEEDVANKTLPSAFQFLRAILLP